MNAGTVPRMLASILLIPASPVTVAEPGEPFVIAIETGKSVEEATATEAQTVYGEPAVPLVRNVTSPTLTAHLPDPGNATGAAVIVAPGGAYIMLAIQHEGTDVARWLAERGIAAFVLKYRVAPMPPTDEGFKALRDRQMREPELLGPVIEEQAPVSIADGRAAVKLLRTKAADWGLDPQRIGILGFSAGGGVALGSASQYEAGERPDFAAIIYGPGANSTVPEDAPPIFIAAAADDPVVPADNSNRLFSRWRAAGRSAELHIYSKGGHGFGMLAQGLPSDHWIEAFYAWLVARSVHQENASRQQGRFRSARSARMEKGRIVAADAATAWCDSSFTVRGREPLLTVPLSAHRGLQCLDGDKKRF